MSGQHEQQDKLDQVDRLDPLDATMDLSRLIERVQSQLQAGEHGHGNGRAAGNGGGDSHATQASSPFLAERATAVEAKAPVPRHAAVAEPRAQVRETAADVVKESDPADPSRPGEVDGLEPSSPADAQADIAGSDAEVADVTPDAPLPGPQDAVTRLEPGSRADLRQRLERLPFGHPSSPYHVDGECKPPPPRLKHLELAPPARDWVSEIRASSRAIGADSPAAETEAQDSWQYSAVAVGAAIDDDGPDGITVAPHGPGGVPSYDGPEGRAAVDYGMDSPAVGDSIISDSLASDSVVSDSLVSDSVASDSVASGDGAVAGITGDHPEHAEATGAASPGGSGGRHGRRGQEAGSRPATVAPRSAVDGSWTWGRASLTQDQVRVAEEMRDRFSAAEGRNLFGSYGASGLTPMMRSVEALLEHGRLAPDTEQDALLDPDTFKARFSDLLRRYPDRTAEQLARRVPGALCYSFVFETAHYSDGIWQVQEGLQARGYQLQARKNAWGNTENRCVFSMWRDPATDLPFQVQFHTPASLGAQQLARTSATLISDPRIPAGEAANLRSDLVSAWAALPPPPGNDQIGDYRRGSGTAPRG